MSDQKEHIVITVSFIDGRVVVNPEFCEANRNENIRWKSDYQFVIQFGQSSPFKKFKYHSTEDNGKFFAKAKIDYDSGNMGAKKFKYSVAATKNGNIDMLDPEIIVPRGSRG